MVFRNADRGTADAVMHEGTATAAVAVLAAIVGAAAMNAVVATEQRMSLETALETALAHRPETPPRGSRRLHSPPPTKNSKRRQASLHLPIRSEAENRPRVRRRNPSFPPATTTLPGPALPRRALLRTTPPGPMTIVSDWNRVAEPTVRLTAITPMPADDDAGGAGAKWKTPAKFLFRARNPSSRRRSPPGSLPNPLPRTQLLARLRDRLRALSLPQLANRGNDGNGAHAAAAVAALAGTAPIADERKSAARVKALAMKPIPPPPASATMLSPTTKTRSTAVPSTRSSRPKSAANSTPMKCSAPTASPGPQRRAGPKATSLVRVAGAAAAAVAENGTAKRPRPRHPNRTPTPSNRLRTSKARPTAFHWTTKPTRTPMNRPRRKATKAS